MAPKNPKAQTAKRLSNREVKILTNTDGYCYLRLFKCRARRAAAATLRTNPCWQHVKMHATDMHAHLDHYRFDTTSVKHEKVRDFCTGEEFINTTTQLHVVRDNSAAPFTHPDNASLIGASLHPNAILKKIQDLMRNPGPNTQTAVDNLEAQFVTTSYARLSKRYQVNVASNLSNEAHEKLCDLFDYNIFQATAPSNHPALAAFRTLCHQYVYHKVGANNILEVGPNLGKMATNHKFVPAHSCSPTLDGRDEARAILMGTRINKRHTAANTKMLLDRSNGVFSSPQRMCNNKVEDCDVQAPVIYSAFSLQDAQPSDIPAIMDRHGSRTAYILLMLPVPLAYADEFREDDTGCVWKRDGPMATCNPGYNDAGYSHNMEKIQRWVDGFDGLPLFAEVEKQFGSSYLFKITRATVGSAASYPINIATLMDQFVLITGTTGASVNFLTSASHYEKLTSYLNMAYSKIEDNIVEKALERIAVLSPAVLVGNQKHTSRWVLTANQALDVACCAAADVQRFQIRKQMAEDMTGAELQKMKSTLRRMQNRQEPTLFHRFTAVLRGEMVINSGYTVADRIADFLDGGRKASFLAARTAMPAHRVMANGSTSTPAPTPSQVQPVQDEFFDAPEGKIAPGRRVMQQPMPAPDQWHRLELQNAVHNYQQIPQRRNARMVNAYNPAADLAIAQNQTSALAINALTILQNAALAAISWTSTTYLDLLLIGPAGTGKSTDAFRMLPAGSLVLVPTNKLANDTAAAHPDMIVRTFDTAVAKAHEYQDVPAIFIDEVFLCPHLYVLSMATLGKPIIAAGCPGQRRYNGNLGPAFDPHSIPVDHVALYRTIHRFGPDVTAQVERHAGPIYRAMFNLGPGAVFAPGPNNNIRNTFQGPGMNLVCHHNNISRVSPNAITIDSSQGSQYPDVLLHVFSTDLPFFLANPYALSLALSRTTGAVTIINHNQADAALRAYLQVPTVDDSLIPRQPNGNVFGSLRQPLYDASDDTPRTVLVQTISDPAAARFEHPVTQPIGYAVEVPADIHCAMAECFLLPPDPSDMQSAQEELALTKIDPRTNTRLPQFTATPVFHAPALLPHVGYPYCNEDVVSALYAIADRYVKHQNVNMPLSRAAQLADMAFEAWRVSFINPKASAAIPSASFLAQHWLSGRSLSQVAAILRAEDNTGTARMMSATYFLKAQGKPKFGITGFSIASGQGILATDKLLNACTCPFTTAAADAMQRLLKPGFIYDQHYEAKDLDDAIYAVVGPGPHRSLSIDLTQQDSSHTLVHRLIIGKVMKFLGFGDDVISLYLLSREKRHVLGLKLPVSFDVIERLFSGEPGTAFFNFIMSTSTTAMTHDLSRVKLFVGKGDDNSTIPPAPRKTLAFNYCKETGVTQKTDVCDYFDFANRIWTSSGRSFSDPIRMLSKFTCRLRGRDNTGEEYQAFMDQNFTPDADQEQDLLTALVSKHKVDPVNCKLLVTAVIAMRDPKQYMSLLRPSKRPAEYLPTLRHCCGTEVVFENRTDRCAPDAIAFWIDKPVDEITAWLHIHRRSNPSPESVDADTASPHIRAKHMTGDEIKLCLNAFGRSMRRNADGLSLHLCRGHVSVVRGNNRRMELDNASVYGSLGSGLNTSLCLLLCLLTSALAIVVSYGYVHYLDRPWYDLPFVLAVSLFVTANFHRQLMVLRRAKTPTSGVIRRTLSAIAKSPGYINHELHPYMTIWADTLCLFIYLLDVMDKLRSWFYARSYQGRPHNRQKPADESPAPSDEFWATDLAKCLKHVTGSRKKFYQKCHPDKLMHRFNRLCVTALSPYIGSGQRMAEYPPACAGDSWKAQPNPSPNAGSGPTTIAPTLTAATVINAATTVVAAITPLATSTARQLSKSGTSVALATVTAARNVLQPNAQKLARQAAQVDVTHVASAGMVWLILLSATAWAFVKSKLRRRATPQIMDQQELDMQLLTDQPNAHRALPRRLSARQRHLVRILQHVYRSPLTLIRPTMTIEEIVWHRRADVARQQRNHAEQQAIEAASSKPDLAEPSSTPRPTTRVVQHGPSTRSTDAFRGTVENCLTMEAAFDAALNMDAPFLRVHHMQRVPKKQRMSYNTFSASLQLPLVPKLVRGFDVIDLLVDAVACAGKTTALRNTLPPTAAVGVICHSREFADEWADHGYTAYTMHQFRNSASHHETIVVDEVFRFPTWFLAEVIASCVKFICLGDSEQTPLLTYPDKHYDPDAFDPGRFRVRRRFTARTAHALPPQHARFVQLYLYEAQRALASPAPSKYLSPMFVANGLRTGRITMYHNMPLVPRNADLYIASSEGATNNFRRLMPEVADRIYSVERAQGMRHKHVVILVEPGYVNFPFTNPWLVVVAFTRSTELLEVFQVAPLRADDPRTDFMDMHFVDEFRSPRVTTDYCPDDEYASIHDFAIPDHGINYPAQLATPYSPLTAITGTNLIPDPVDLD
ncbi:polyprotein [Sclerotinia sclerotiorum mycoalphavirus virus 1]|uniref:Polyprotein n=1 Tax=Sclerotinia sclerotiorum mycoalphavirus virus 1 TaxID=2777094 RepID=A0A866W3C5_9VIRU|nr:polyprotein [Sclerotinia sclerotiorum mycoalphavirus virus 1]